MNEVLNILYQSNDYYAVVTGVSLTSLLINNTDIDEINIFILDDQISEKNKVKFEQICKQYERTLVFVNTDIILNRLKELEVAPFKNTYTTYFKLFAINELDLKTHRVLQLDGDTIIVGSLKELCYLDIDEYVCAATYDCTQNSYKSLINIPITDKYYNCGVLLINQHVWREECCEEKIAHHLRCVRNRYYTVDQDIINVLFRKKICYLDIKYNFNSGFYIYGIQNSLRMYDLKPAYYNTVMEIEEAYENPVIYHCMGAMTGRPWELDSIHPQNDLFASYLGKSPWAAYQKQRVKRSNIFRIQRILYRLLPRQMYIPIHARAQKHYLTNMDKAVRSLSENK